MLFQITPISSRPGFENLLFSKQSLQSKSIEDVTEVSTYIDASSSANKISTNTEEPRAMSDSDFEGYSNDTQEEVWWPDFMGSQTPTTATPVLHLNFTLEQPSSTESSASHKETYSSNKTYSSTAESDSTISSTIINNTATYNISHFQPINNATTPLIIKDSHTNSTAEPMTETSYSTTPPIINRNTHIPAINTTNQLNETIVVPDSNNGDDVLFAPTTATLLPLDDENEFVYLDPPSVNDFDDSLPKIASPRNIDLSFMVSSSLPLPKSTTLPSSTASTPQSTSTLSPFLIDIQKTTSRALTISGWSRSNYPKHHDKAQAFTVYGEACYDRCEKRDYSYTWCHKFIESSNGYWSTADVCTNDDTITPYQENCIDDCSRRGYSYFWCHTGTITWDYCTPKSLVDYLHKRKNL